MVAQKEDVAAIRTEQGIICAGCMTDADWGAIAPERIVTKQEKKEENIIFFATDAEMRFSGPEIQTEDCRWQIIFASPAA